MRQLLTCALLTLLVAAPAAAADRVTLTNGDRLTGTLTAYDGAQFRMKTELAGTVRLSWDAVEQIIADMPLTVTLADGRVLTGPLSIDEEELTLTTDDGPIVAARDTVLAVRTLEAQAIYEQRLHPGLLQQWEGAANAGLSSTRGNSESTTVAVGVDALRQTEQDKLSTYFNLIFSRDSGSNNGETFANTLRTGARYDYNLTQRLFTFGLTDFEFDQLQDLDLRWVLGGGLGWRFKQTERTRFEVFSGATLNQEYFTGEDVRRSGEALFGEELSYKLTSRTTLKERLTFFPNLTETGEYRVSFDSSAVHKLSNWLSWQATLSNRYLSNPPAGLEKNDLLFTTGLRVTFSSVIE